MRRLAFSIAVVSTVFASVGLGCSCQTAERPCEGLQSEVVFVGRVTALQRGERNYTMVFEVKEGFRGTTGNQISIETGAGDPDCGTPLPVGAEYLIFASRDIDGKLWTGLCSGNRQLGNGGQGDAYLTELRATTKNPTGAVFGRVLQSRIESIGPIEGLVTEPAEGVTVRAVSKDLTTQTKTDSKGVYEFRTLPPGTYVIAPEVNDDVDFDRSFLDLLHEAVLSGGSCKNINFFLTTAAPEPDPK